MSTKVTAEVMENMIRDYQRQRITGTVTITFNDGDITYVRNELKHNAEHVFDTYANRVEDRKSRKVLVVRRKTMPEAVRSGLEKPDEGDADN